MLHLSPSCGPTIGPQEPSGRSWNSIEDNPIRRHEAKYVVPTALMPEIRRFIQPFVHPDKNGRGEVPRYSVRTIQLDGRDLTLHRAKEVESLNRFKLRIRTYGSDGKAPVFLEIKRKLGDMIVKSRATIAAEAYEPEIITHPHSHLNFRSDMENMNYLNFIRLCREIGAEPMVMIQYLRESYMGRHENYARITFDTQIQYQPIRSYRFASVNDRKWRAIDTQTGLGSEFSGFIMEVKTSHDMPFWMAHLIRTFDLIRVGFCKYSTAMRMELIHFGHEFSATGENCTHASQW